MKAGTQRARVRGVGRGARTWTAAKAFTLAGSKSEAAGWVVNCDFVTSVTEVVTRDDEHTTQRSTK